MEYLIRHYGPEQGALEIEYIEEFFGEFPRRKTAAEIIERLADREHLIVMAVAALPDEPGTLVPVSYKVCHELFVDESDPRLADLSAQLEDVVRFTDRRVLYSWIGGTRIDWRGQGHFRALTEEQEAWAVATGFDEIVVKTKNRYYEMRSTLGEPALRHREVRAQSDREPRVEALCEQAARTARPRPAPQRPDASRGRRTLTASYACCNRPGRTIAGGPSAWTCPRARRSRRVDPRRICR